MSYIYSDVRRFKGFVTTSYYTDEEYKAFTKQVLKKLDEYFVDDCSFVMSLRAKVIINVICSSKGNRYRISYDEDVLDTYGQSKAEFDHYAYSVLLDNLEKDINYLKDSVNKIIDAARTGTPLVNECPDSDDDDD